METEAEQEREVQRWEGERRELQRRGEERRELQRREEERRELQRREEERMEEERCSGQERGPEVVQERPRHSRRNVRGGRLR